MQRRPAVSVLAGMESPAYIHVSPKIQMVLACAVKSRPAAFAVAVMASAVQSGGFEKVQAVELHLGE